MAKKDENKTPKYRYLGEDLIHPDLVRQIFARVGDGQIFTVEESAMRGQAGSNLPPEIEARLRK